MADAKITSVFWKFQLKDSTPGGSKQGNIAARKIKVIGVVFHINLLKDPQKSPTIQKKESVTKKVRTCEEEGGEIK